MQNLPAAALERKWHPAARPEIRTPATSVSVPVDELLDLARHVERLGRRGWADPETFVLAKLTLAAELRRLAGARS
jgi:hypothetical protein